MEKYTNFNDCETITTKEYEEVYNKDVYNLIKTGLLVNEEVYDALSNICYYYDREIKKLIKILRIVE